MNERIKQLAEQCGFRSNPNIYDRNQSFDIPKFAQLIIKECIYAVVDTGGIDRYHYAEAISEHFGIKE